MTKNILAILYLIVFLFSAIETSAYKRDTHAEISKEAFNVSVLKSGYLSKYPPGGVGANCQGDCEVTGLRT